MSDWQTLRDQVGVVFRPIDQWPGKIRYERDVSPFSAPLKDTLRMLKTEFTALQTADIVLQIAIREKDLRLDGLPRAGAIAEHPGIILSFRCKHGHLRFAFDRYRRWHDNLRAIAMHLHHLRMASHHGVGSDGEQYRGWTALPPGPSPDEPHQSEDEKAAQVIADILQGAIATEALLSDATLCRGALREAAKRVHPDFGGSDEAFRTYMESAEVLKRRHGL